MNRLDPPDYFDDTATLDALALNKRLKCYPQLAAQAPTIKSGYAQYIAASGNANYVANVALPDLVSEQLQELYASPPKCLTHIKRLRERNDAHCCPMCGSFHTSTLDHLLPKSDYPVFAIFGHNLVPACSCNSRRSNKLTGAAGERILHPYFDDVLRERLFIARFEDLGLAPQITLQPLLPPTHSQALAVQFHITNVVESAQILKYLSHSWANLLKRPWLAAAELRNAPTSRDNLKNIIAAELERMDSTYQSQNNWASVFLAGLLDDDVLDWIFAAFQRPGWVADGPLVDGIV